MKNRLLTTVAIALLFIAGAPPADEQTFAGLQPQLSLDKQGIVRLAFGRADSIFCMTSNNGGKDFSEAALVGIIPGMHLGTTRGPQLASSARYSVITAIDKSSTIHYFHLSHAVGNWQYGGVVNDAKASAPEGLVSVAADARDRFYAVWLDVRKDEKNNICFSTLDGGATAWTKNRLAYISPDGHVCECCKPALSVNGTTVAIQFRNWRSGARDVYLITSSDRGRTFGKAQKLGTGTWKLDACPMDGGGVAVDDAGMVHTVWRRENVVYYCRPGATEIEVAPGRLCSIATGANNKHTVALMQQNKTVKIINVNTKKETMAGAGGFAKGLILPDGTLLCAWENNKTIQVKRLPLL